MYGYRKELDKLSQLLDKHKEQMIKGANHIGDKEILQRYASHVKCLLLPIGKDLNKYINK
jgi:hypothetical protein